MALPHVAQGEASNLRKLGVSRRYAWTVLSDVSTAYYQYVHMYRVVQPNDFIRSTPMITCLHTLDSGLRNFKSLRANGYTHCFKTVVQTAMTCWICRVNQWRSDSCKKSAHGHIPSREEWQHSQVSGPGSISMEVNSTGTGRLHPMLSASFACNASQCFAEMTLDSGGGKTGRE